MTVDQAKDILGLGPSPTPQEIQKAFRYQALRNHPDRGGTHEKQVDINVAKDILEGKSRADNRPPLSWGASNPEAARKAEEDRARKAALALIASESAATVKAAEDAIRSADLIGWRLNLSEFLNSEYRTVLDKIHDDIEANAPNKDMQKAMNFMHMLTGMAHRLATKFPDLTRMTGQANADLLNLGGAQLTWSSVADIYVATKKFIASFNEFAKVNGGLQMLIMSSELVPFAWDDLTHHESSVINSFRDDFKGFSDHNLNRFESTLREAVGKVMKAAEPYGFKHHGDWKSWGIPGDFEHASKVVFASGAS